MKRLLASFVAVAVLFTFAGSARADRGEANDPDDTSGPLDIRRVSHDNDDAEVTFRVEMYERFTLDDIFLIRWDFDFSRDGSAAEACIILKRLGKTPTLRGAFFGDCGPETWATADARWVGGDAIEITFPVIDFIEGGGLRDDAYSYRVTTEDGEGVEDTAPEDGLIEHSGIPRSPPRPGSAETQLGYASQGEAVPGRQPGRGEGPALEKEGPLAGIPIIGNLCSGAACFVIATATPFVLAAVGGLALIVVRRRRLRPLADPVWTEGVQDPGARSRPGNV